MDRLVNKKQNKLSVPESDNWLLNLSTDKLIDIVCNPVASAKDRTRAIYEIKLKHRMYVGDCILLQDINKSVLENDDKNWNLEGYTVMYIEEAREYYIRCISLLEHKDIISPRSIIWIESLKSVIEQINYQIRDYIDFCGVEGKDFILMRKHSKEEIKEYEWLTPEEFEKKYPEKMEKFLATLEKDFDEDVQELIAESDLMDDKWQKKQES